MEKKEKNAAKLQKNRNKSRTNANFFGFSQKNRLDKAGSRQDKATRRSVSRVLSARGRDGHSSGTPVAGRLVRSTLTAHPGNAMRPLQREVLPSLFDLAPGGACHAVPIAGDAVRSYRTFSPLLLAERFVFCCAFPRVASAGRYPAPCFHGARTFLRLSAAAIRPSDRGLYTGRCGVCQFSPTRIKRCRKMAWLSASAAPSMRQGRKCRCMARSTMARSASACVPSGFTS